MSLQTRITACIQAIAADVKSLISRITTLESQSVKEYVSPQQNWTGGMTYVLTHNLGYVPHDFIVEGVALIALYGLSIGQTVKLADMTAGSATNGVEFRRATTTTVDMLIAHYGISMMNASGDATSITTSQVQIRARVRA